jgi:hypothetical protein
MTDEREAIFSWFDQVLTQTRQARAAEKIVESEPILNEISRFTTEEQAARQAYEDAINANIDGQCAELSAAYDEHCKASFTAEK